MNDILHANIFFFITSVATVLIALLVSIILFYIARIMRDISDIVRKLNNASKDLERDFQDLRSEIKNEGAKLRSVVDVVLGFALSRIQKRTARKSKNQTTAEPSEDSLQ
jgi:predicted PurR-regulated permease PerM